MEFAVMPNSKETDLIRIEAPHFVATVVIDEWGRVLRAESDLAWAVGKHVIEQRRYCRRMGWKLTGQRGAARIRP